MTKTIVLPDINRHINIRKSKRAKYMQIKIDHSGKICLVLPSGYTENEGIRFLTTKTKWINRKLSSVDFYNKKFRYLGEEIILKQDMEGEGQKFIPLLVNKNSNISEETYNITSSFYDKWLFEKAENYIIPRVFKLAEIHGFSFSNIKVKRMKTRWGSCSSKKRLSFNYKLMYFNTKIIDYVIVHELCHLKVMNHSMQFWQLVGSMIPDYRILRKQLTYN
ncbi:MAG: SprT family zinc-dependent metalloprotease [Melioribacteraceae bacterium]|nr:SprT family zinc-dependent metalloprotease [Melioribacteraceae bacterium]